ncbi:pksN [Symbiodinium sp. CCMP2592]|nr:pksN [Symbiodinium sp. CCMP2592]
MADGAGVAFWRLRPGNKAVVYYDDDDVWHERQILLPGGSPESYWIRTPTLTYTRKTYKEVLPKDLDECDMFKEDVTDDDLRKWMKDAIQEHVRAYGREPDLSDVQVELADGAAGPGTWLVADPRHGLSLGTPITPDFNKDLKLDDVNAVVNVRGQWVRVEWVAIGQEASWKKARASELNSPCESDEALAGDLKLLPAVQDAPEDNEGTLVKDKAGEDAGTLWIIYDDQNEDIVSGPQSTMHMLKHIHKHGGEPKSWLQLWLRKHNVSESDRVCHELKTLVDIVYLGGCYDQLNLASLASFEAASRRIQTIVKAFSAASGGSGPDWSHARLYTGQATADDIVSPELRSWAAKRGKEEVELAQARAKIRDSKRLGSHATESNETGDHSEPPAPALPGRGRGRGRTVKGLEVLVQVEQAVVAETGATFTPSALQSEIVERVVKLSSDAYELDSSFSSPPTPEAALRELLRGADDYVDSVSTLAACRRERISMPDSLHGSPDVLSLLPDDARHYLEAPERMLRPEEDSQCDIVPYWHPALRNSARAYKDLVRHLHKIGYLDFTLEPKERAGTFFVNKANGKIRLIIDGRRANARLREPPGVSLATAEAFARFEMEDCSDQDPVISVGLSDVKDCFHRMAQPRWLREYFALDPIPACWVGLQGTSLGGITLARDDLIYPMPAPLCMGCSWSLFFAQKANQHIMSSVPALKGSRSFSDRSEPVVFNSKDEQAGSSYHFVYVDNLGILSETRQHVDTAIVQVTEAFHATQLLLHPGEVKDSAIDSLGCRLEGKKHSTRLKPASLHRVRQATLAILNRGRCTGQVMEVVVGHLTHSFLIARPLMAIFDHCYRFIRRHYTEKAKLWVSVQDELRAALGGIWWNHLLPGRLEETVEHSGVKLRCKPLWFWCLHVNLAAHLGSTGRAYARTGKIQALSRALGKRVSFGKSLHRR